MKILIITKSYYPEKSIVNKIAEGLFKRGHSVTVLTAKPSFKLGYILPGYQNISYELVNGIKVHRVDVRPYRRSRYSHLANGAYFYKNARKWVKNTKEKFDVVYTYSFSSSNSLSAGNLYKKLHKVPHVAHVVSMSPDDLYAKGYIFKYSLDYLCSYLASRIRYGKADELIVSSPVYIDYVKNVLKIKKTGTTYIPNIPLVLEGIKNPYVYKKGFNIVYYGNIDKNHILNLVPEAVNKLSRQDIYFHIIGDGKLSNELLEQIKYLGLNDRVILHGEIPLEDVPNYFVNADACYISVSNKHYFGRAIDSKLIYLMSQKKPIIAVVDGDNAEVVRDSGGGTVIGDNVDDLVFAFGKTASLRKSELESRANKNAEYYLKHFKLDNVVADVESVLLKKSL